MILNQTNLASLRLILCFLMLACGGTHVSQRSHLSDDELDEERASSGDASGANDQSVDSGSVTPVVAPESELVGSIELRASDGKEFDLTSLIKGIEDQEVIIKVVYNAVNPKIPTTKFEISLLYNCTSPKKIKLAPNDETPFWEAFDQSRTFIYSLPFGQASWKCGVQFKDDRGRISKIYSKEIKFDSKLASVKGSLSLRDSSGKKEVGPKLIGLPGERIKINIFLTAVHQLKSSGLVKSNLLYDCSALNDQVDDGGWGNLRQVISHSLVVPSDSYLWKCGVQYYDTDGNVSKTYLKEIIVESSSSK